MSSLLFHWHSSCIMTYCETLAFDMQVVEVTDDGGERGPKVACSIKLVDQREGTDLDPHNVKWQPRGEGGPGGHGARGPAQAAAVVQQG